MNLHKSLKSPNSKRALTPKASHNRASIQMPYERKNRVMQPLWTTSESPMLTATSQRERWISLKSQAKQLLRSWKNKKPGQSGTTWSVSFQDILIAFREVARTRNVWQSQGRYPYNHWRKSSHKNPGEGSNRKQKRCRTSDP